MLRNIKISKYKIDNFFLNNIASGSEGCIVKGKDNSLLKLFYTKDEEVLENKYKKIIELYKKNIPFLTNPVYTVSCNGNFVGYGMKNNPNYRSFDNVCIDRRRYLYCLKDIKKKLLELEQENIIYTDLRLNNILIDYYNYTIKFCDIDNVILDNLKCDKLLYELSILHLEKYPDFDIHAYMHNLLLIKEYLGFGRGDFSLSTVNLDNVICSFVKETFNDDGLEVFKEMLGVVKDPSKFSKRYMIEYLK